MRTAKNRAWLRDIAVGKIFFHRQWINFAPQAGMRHQGFEFGAENELPVIQIGVIQRLHAEAVAHQKESLLVTVPQRERKHAAKAMHAGFAPGFPGVDDDFGV